MSKRCWTLQSRMEAQFAVSFYPILLSGTQKLEILRRAEEIRAVHSAFLPKSLPRWQVKKELEKFRSDGLFKKAVENHKTQNTALSNV